jgi:hypothetical protein
MHPEWMVLALDGNWSIRNNAISVLELQRAILANLDDGRYRGYAADWSVK